MVPSWKGWERGAFVSDGGIPRFPEMLTAASELDPSCRALLGYNLIQWGLGYIGSYMQTVVY